MNACPKCNSTVTNPACPECAVPVDPEIVALLDSLRAVAKESPGWNRKPGGRFKKRRARRGTPPGGDSRLPPGDRE